MRKANWSGHATDVDILIEEVDPTPENYERCVEDIRVTSRKHIPRACRSHYIPGISVESKSIYEAYHPLDSTTLDTGNELIINMAAENKRTWEDRITSTDLNGYIWKLQNHLAWSLQTKLHTIARQRPMRCPKLLHFLHITMIRFN